MTLWLLKETAVRHSGLITVSGNLEADFANNGEEVKFRMHQILEIMKDQSAVWTPYRDLDPKPYLRFHMKGGEVYGTGTAVLEGDHGAWGFHATFEKDPQFAELLEHARASVDVAYRIHPDGVQAVFPGPDARGLALLSPSQPKTLNPITKE